jgi:hypothetical protein
MTARPANWRIFWRATRKRFLTSMAAPPSRPLDFVGGQFAFVADDAGDDPGIHADDQIGHVGDVDVMGDDQRRHFLFLVHPLEDVEDDPGIFFVEGTGGLVAEDDRRVLGDRTRKRNALLLAPGQFGGKFVAVGKQSDGGQHIGDGSGVFRQVAAEADVFFDREVLQEVELLESKAQMAAAELCQLILRHPTDDDAIDFDRAGRGFVEAAQHIEERGLPAAAGAENDDKVAIPDGEVDVFQCNGLDGSASVDFGQVFDFDGHRPFSLSDESVFILTHRRQKANDLMQNRSHN